MFKNLEPYLVVLASNSPRRQELLANIGVDFIVKPSLGEENYPASLEPELVAEFLAKQKSDWFSSFDQNELYITADTVVILNNAILGKPKDELEAKEMLGNLSGNTHDVITGVSLKSKSLSKSFSVKTKVLFRHLSNLEIDYYVNKFKPFDKAGSYGIQEWIGMIGITEIKGSYFNVMGLPTQVLFDEIRRF